jgi:uncharacterized membrane protein YgdD (TMEM256/DUF423 family)
MMKWILLTAILFGFSAFILDAFFAHGLKNFLGNSYSESAEHALTTASRYQLMAAFFLLILLFVYRGIPHPCIIVAQIFAIMGVLLFCFTIYAKHLLAITQVARIAPMGGIAFMLSFLALMPLMRTL